MKKALLIAIVFISPYISVGQIVLNQTDLPNIGDIQIMVSVDSTQGVGLSPGASGANVIWNFSSLIAGISEDTTYYENPTSTPYGSSFPSANISTKEWSQNENCFGYWYYINNSLGMQTIGKGDCWSTPPATLISGNSLSFPLLTYGNFVNHSLRGVLDSTGPGDYRVFLFINVSTADAWGTITTPVGTVSAIRIYTTVTFYDSSYVGGVGTQNSLITDDYNYKWYEKDLGWPVLDISKNSMEYDYKTARYSASLATGINSIAYSDNSLSIYPNPNNGVFSISWQNAVAKSEVEIYNVLGEKVYATSNFKQQTSNEIDLLNSPKGFYFVKINDGTKIYYRKIVVQ